MFLPQGEARQSPAPRQRQLRSCQHGTHLGFWAALSWSFLSDMGQDLESWHRRINVPVANRQVKPDGLLLLWSLRWIPAVVPDSVVPPFHQRLAHLRYLSPIPPLDELLLPVGLQDVLHLVQSGLHASQDDNRRLPTRTARQTLFAGDGPVHPAM